MKAPNLSALILIPWPPVAYALISVMMHCIMMTVTPNCLFPSHSKYLRYIYCGIFYDGNVKFNKPKSTGGIKAKGTV